MKSFFKILLSTTIFLIATSANALLIEISDNADFDGVLGTVKTADDSGIEGYADITVSLGDWIINSVTGLSNPILGDDYTDVLHLDSLNVTGESGGTIYVRLTESGYTRYDANYIAEFGGITDGSVSFQTYVNSTLLTDSGALFGAFSGGDSGTISMTDPYSISILATITHYGAQDATSFDYEVTVPEPGTLALLGIGLLGIGLSRRRRT